MADLEILQNAVALNRQHMLEELLALLGVDEIDEIFFQELIATIGQHDAKRDRLLKALEGQEIVDFVLKDKLI
jgi:hypothetical protein